MPSTMHVSKPTVMRTMQPPALPIKRIGQLGLELIKHFEGCQLKAYKDSVGIWTIGYGHTGGIQEGQTITIDQAEHFLRNDCVIAELVVNEKVIVPLNQNQFDALVSFVFNLGGTRFKGSTMLFKLNAGDYNGAADEFLRWNKAGGVILPGLSRRRKAERELFLKLELLS